MIATSAKTLTVTISDAEIHRHAAGTIRQLRDTRHRSLRFRYSTTDRARGSWHVVVADTWGKAGNFPDINTKTMLATLPEILARRSADAGAKSTASHWETVGDLLTWYLDRMTRDRGLSAKRKASAKSAVKCHLLPRLGDLPLADLGKSTIDQRLMWPLQERFQLSFVRYVYGVLAVAFQQAARLDLLAHNPMAGLKYTDFVRTRIRRKAARLRGDDLPALLALLADQFEVAAVETLLPLMMLCHGTRLGETRLARWKNVNLATRQWFIPAADTKTRAEHTLPLTDQAAALLERYRARQVASGYTGAFLFPGTTGRAMSASKASAMFVSVSSGEWTSHDLRKVARTAWTDLGVDYMVGELLLNHAMKDLDATYIHTTAEGLKRRALEAWHDHLDHQGFKSIHTETLPGQDEGPDAREPLNSAASSVMAHPSQGRSQFDKATLGTTTPTEPGDGNE